jgi:hypothetical protein
LIFADGPASATRPHALGLRRETPKNGNFAVTVRGDSVHDNIEMLGGATRYAQEHMLAIESIP